MSDERYQPPGNQPIGGQPQPKPANYQHQPAPDPHHGGQPGQAQSYQHYGQQHTQQGYVPQYQHPPRPSVFAPVKSFVGALLDVKFSSFITTKLISLLYALGIVVSAIVTLLFIVMGFSADAVAGVVMLIISPIILLAVLAGFRVALEAVVIIFKIGEYLRNIDSKLK